jgi:hypothetical protein
VITDVTADDDRVVRADFAYPESQAPRTHADARRHEVEPAGLAAWHDLGVARHDANAGFAGCLGKAGHDAFEPADFKPFLNDGTETEIERCRARNREIVHRAVHRE